MFYKIPILFPFGVADILKLLSAWKGTHQFSIWCTVLYIIWCTVQYIIFPVGGAAEEFNNSAELCILFAHNYEHLHCKQGFHRTTNAKIIHVQKQNVMPLFFIHRYPDSHTQSTTIRIILIWIRIQFQAVPFLLGYGSYTSVELKSKNL